VVMMTKKKSPSFYYSRDIKGKEDKIRFGGHAIFLRWCVMRAINLSPLC